MDNSLIIAVVLIAIVALVFIVRAASAGKPAAHDTTAAARHHHEHGVTDSAAAAVEDVVGPLVGIDIHPDIPKGPADDLTVLKGLGPKAAAQLNALGICRFEQIANWSEADAAAIDARMGAFKGRIARDQWIEQARLLVDGDRAGFETKFGRLGG